MTSPISSGYVRGGGNTKRWLTLDHSGGEIQVVNPPIHHVSGPTQAESPTMVPSPQQMGYTGSTCTKCNGTRVVRTGHCETCQDCGETTACA